MLNKIVWIIWIKQLNTIQFSLLAIKRLMFSWTTCTDKLLHDHCEHLIAPGTLGHIAQKTLHLAATNSTHGEHHNTNFPPNPQPPVPPRERPHFPWPGNTSFAPANWNGFPTTRAEIAKSPSKKSEKSQIQRFGLSAENLAAAADLEKFSRWAG